MKARCERGFTGEKGEVMGLQGRGKGESRTNDDEEEEFWNMKREGVREESFRRDTKGRRQKGKRGIAVRRRDHSTEDACQRRNRRGKGGYACGERHMPRDTCPKILGSRPVIGLDDCFLKSKYGGCCFTAIGLDAMNGILSLGFYICKGENGDTWRQFLCEMKPYLDIHKDKLTFISDKQKGLISVVDEYFPDSNLSNTDNMCMLFVTDTEPRSYWARADFDWISKCDELTNNFSESFNSWILKIIDKPLVNFLDKYNLNLLQLVYGRRELSMSLMTGDVAPNVLFMIKMRELRYNCPQVKEALVGKVIQYCSPYFSVEAFRATSATYLYPIDNIEDWPKIDNIEELVLPPKNTRKSGRPKKQRIRGEDEPLKSHRKCPKCGTPGHNTLTCDARKKGVHSKRRKPQDQGAQYHNEAAVAQAVPVAPPMQPAPSAPPMQPTPDLPEPSNRRGRKIRNVPLQEETPAAPTQGGRRRALGPDEVQHDAAPAQAQGGRGRAPGQDEVQYDATPAQTQRGRGRSRRSRGGSVPQPPPMQEAPPI
ncbi:hypothetical protein IFM89_033982 [Coptis chinensis]|uniref:MULE transposase domain-containing protein n=1 Tax=Coptis chinensis TaxID=261450 RepID=A0A835MAS4_9MAGN|nr:hypothetical protein IFM89_033982 [Coptis chinensis]